MKWCFTIISKYLDVDLDWRKALVKLTNQASSNIQQPIPGDSGFFLPFQNIKKHKTTV